MITFGSIVATAITVLFLGQAFAFAGLFWMQSKRLEGAARRRSLLIAVLIAGWAVAVVLSLALP